MLERRQVRHSTQTGLLSGPGTRHIHSCLKALAPGLSSDYSPLPRSFWIAVHFSPCRSPPHDFAEKPSLNGYFCILLCSSCYQHLKPSSLFISLLSYCLSSPKQKVGPVEEKTSSVLFTVGCSVFQACLTPRMHSVNIWQLKKWSKTSNRTMKLDSKCRRQLTTLNFTVWADIRLFLLGF